MLMLKAKPRSWRWGIWVMKVTGKWGFFHHSLASRLGVVRLGKKNVAPETVIWKGKPPRSHSSVLRSRLHRSFVNLQWWEKYDADCEGVADPPLPVTTGLYLSSYPANHPDWRSGTRGRSAFENGLKTLPCALHPIAECLRRWYDVSEFHVASLWFVFLPFPIRNRRNTRWGHVSTDIRFQNQYLHWQLSHFRYMKSVASMLDIRNVPNNLSESDFARSTMWSHRMLGDTLKWHGNQSQGIKISPQYQYTIRGTEWRRTVERHYQNL